MKRIYVLLAQIFWSVSGGASFLDPYEAQQTSQAFIKSQPDFPKDNVGVVICTGPDGQTHICGGFLVSGKFLLTSAHSKEISNPKSKIFVMNSESDLTFGKTGFPDFKTNFPLLFKEGRAQEVQTVHSLSYVECEKIPDDLFSRTEGKKAEFIKLMQKALSNHEFCTAVDAKTRIRTDCDLVLLELRNPLKGVPPFYLVPSSNSLEATSVYGMGFIQAWSFSTGERFFQGETPELAKRKIPNIQSPSFVKQEKGVFSQNIFKQVYTQSVYGIPGKPKLFSLFVKEDPEDNESFQLAPSLVYNPTVKDPIIFGPFIGGFSGSPIFDQDNHLKGFVSETIPSICDGESLSVNIFQTLTPETVRKIHLIMGVLTAERMDEIILAAEAGDFEAMDQLKNLQESARIGLEIFKKKASA